MIKDNGNFLSGFAYNGKSIKTLVECLYIVCIKKTGLSAPGCVACEPDKELLHQLFARFFIENTTYCINYF